MPLPAVPEIFGVRLPPASDCLASVDFDLVPNKPPPDIKLYDEEVEDIEESESEESDEYEDDDIEMKPPTALNGQGGTPSTMASPELPVREEAPFPISAIADAPEIDMGTPAGHRMETEEPSGGEEEDKDLFGGDGEDEDEDESDGMEEVSTSLTDHANGVKRKLVEEDDYD